MNKLIIISGPSGVGKNAVVDAILKQENNIRRVLTCTTREKRPGEIDGVDYIFLSQDGFKRKIAEGYFLEYEETHGFMYGTPKEEVEKIKLQGKTPLMVIDIKGGLNVKKILGEENVMTIFISVDSKKQLRQRIIQRNQEMDEKELAVRMKTAEHEFDMSFKYDYVVVNEENKLDETVKKVREIVFKATS